MELAGPSIDELHVRVFPPNGTERYVPSADRLLSSVPRVAGGRSVGVILTGMGDDGVAGARSIMAAGGSVIAESELTAVVNGMPGAAVRAGVASHVLPLGDIGNFLAAEVDL
jgi:two-component system chemotaxis response regulator CheB